MAKQKVTQKATAFLRKWESDYWIVERWNAFTRTRQDMFGFIDIVAIAPAADGEDFEFVTIGIQATSVANMAARFRKIRDDLDMNRIARNWLKSGCSLQIWGFRPGETQPEIWDLTLKHLDTKGDDTR